MYLHTRRGLKAATVKLSDGETTTSRAELHYCQKLLGVLVVPSLGFANVKLGKKWEKYSKNATDRSEPNEFGLVQSGRRTKYGMEVNEFFDVDGKIDKVRWISESP